MVENESKREETQDDDAPRFELPVHIPLKKPINDGEKEIKEFVISREPIGADWSGMNVQNATILDFQRIASRLTGIPVPVIKKADTRATMRLAEVIGSFLD